MRQLTFGLPVRSFLPLRLAIYRFTYRETQRQEILPPFRTNVAVSAVVAISAREVSDLANMNFDLSDLKVIGFSRRGAPAPPTGDDEIPGKLSRY